MIVPIGAAIALTGYPRVPLAEPGFFFGASPGRRQGKVNTLARKGM